MSILPRARMQLIPVSEQGDDERPCQQNRAEYVRWRARVFKPAAEKAGVAGLRPYDLPGLVLFVILAAGVNLAEIADEAGNSVEVLSSNYLGVIKKLRGKLPVDAQEAMREARVSPVRHPASEASAG